jgi:hypothetical protein
VVHIDCYSTRSRLRARRRVGAILCRTTAQIVVSDRGRGRHQQPDSLSAKHRERGRAAVSTMFALAAGSPY